MRFIWLRSVLMGFICLRSVLMGCEVGFSINLRLVRMLKFILWLDPGEEWQGKGHKAVRTKKRGGKQNKWIKNRQVRYTFGFSHTGFTSGQLDSINSASVS